MRRILAAFAVVSTLMLPAAAASSETRTYAYDALGRMVGVVTNDSATTTTSIYSFDPASNRQWLVVVQADGTKIPIFRFFGGTQHFYTASYLEGQQSGDVSEGAGFYLVPTGGSGLVAIYRCYNTTDGDHFLSTQNNCEGLTQEGLMGYAYAASASGLVPLYRFYDSATSDHLITVHYDEGAACCTYESILGYVPQ